MQRACPIINALTKVENRWQTKQQWGKLMYQRIYIDIVFMTNFLMDYMLLRLVGKFLHLDGKRRRCVISAAFGSFVSCLLVCAPFKIIFPAAVLIHGGCAFFMASFAFRLKKGGLLVKTILALYFTAFVVGGIYQALETERTMTVKIFLLFLAGIYGALYTLGCVTETFRFGRRNIFPVTLKYQGKLQQTYGFYDTGNLLMDPVKKQPVSIIKQELLGSLISKEQVKKLMDIKDKPEELENTGFVSLQPHFLSCHTADGKKGLLLAVILDELLIQTPERVVHVGKPVLAITSEPSALGEEYEILLNSRLLN